MVKRYGLGRRRLVRRKHYVADNVRAGSRAADVRVLFEVERIGHRRKPFGRVAGKPAQQHCTMAGGGFENALPLTLHERRESVERFHGVRAARRGDQRERERDAVERDLLGDGRGGQDGRHILSVDGLVAARRSDGARGI